MGFPCRLVVCINCIGMTLDRRIIIVSSLNHRLIYFARCQGQSQGQSQGQGQSLIEFSVSVSACKRLPVGASLSSPPLPTSNLPINMGLSLHKLHPDRKRAPHHEMSKIIRNLESLGLRVESHSPRRDNLGGYSFLGRSPGFSSRDPK